MRDSVPSGSYSSVCNVLRQWQSRSSLLIESIDSMKSTDSMIRMVDNLFKSLDIDKSEWLEDIERGDSSSASFLACVEECISERESRFEEGLNIY